MREVKLSTHVFIRKDSIRDLETLRKRLTIRPKFPELKPVPVFVEDDEWFGLPRYHVTTKTLLQDCQVVGDERAFGHDIEMKFTSKLRAEQVPLHAMFKKAVGEGKEGIILKARTGFGKTVCLLDWIAELKITTLVVVPRSFILHQWIERALQHTNLKRSEIGIAQQSLCEFRGKKLVIGMIQSLCKDHYPMEFKKYFGCIVFDEMQTTAAESFSGVLKIFPARCRIGASASSRKDGLEAVYLDALRETVIEVKAKHKDRPRVFLVKWSKPLSLPSYFTKVKGLVRRRGVLISAIAKDVARNKMLVGWIERDQTNTTVQPGCN